MKAWFTPPIGVPLLILLAVVLVRVFRHAM